MRRLGWILFSTAWAAASPQAPADTFYPMVMGISPVAVQAGRTSECEVWARYNLYGAYRVFVTGEGVTGSTDPAPAKPPAKKPNLEKLRIRFRVAANALPGVRDVRLATPQGASTLGQLVIVHDPVFSEKASDNDSIQTAQPIPLPAVVCGAIEKPEDVDYYKFRVAAGTALTFHVRCQQLQDKIHDLQEHADPILFLRNAAGTVLASNDNYFAGDPLLHHHFATAGEYFLEIRDVRYGGNPYWLYSIEINDRAFVTNVHPLRVTPGLPTRLHLVGYSLPPNPTAVLTIPAGTPDGLHWTALTLPDGRRTNPVPVEVSRLPDSPGVPLDHGTPALAQRIGVPVGIGGRLDREGQADCYAFEAKTGEQFCFEVVARSRQSALDSNLRILNARGERLAENDDATGRYISADSLIEDWTAPAAGRYVVEIRDVHARGGPTFPYFLKIVRSRPSFSLEADTDKTLLAPGTASVVFVHVTRKNGFDGEVHLGAEGLLPGVTACCGRILAGGTDGCVILQAHPRAPRGAANVRITGTATQPGPHDRPLALVAEARPLQEVYMPGGGRYHFPAEMHTVSVGDPLDLKSVHIRPIAVALKPGESKQVDVTLTRAPWFKGNVTLDVIFQHLDTVYGNSMPPGVTLDNKASQTLLNGTQATGHLTLRAAADAKPVKDQLVPVMAHVSINFVVKFTYCAEPLLVTVVGK